AARVRRQGGTGALHRLGGQGCGDHREDAGCRQAGGAGTRPRRLARR
ncbi:MAG: Methionine aminopeptidase, partial [uncultured Nocardioides sp.]